MKNILSFVALCVALLGFAPAFADGQICAAGEIPAYLTKNDEAFVAIVLQQDRGTPFDARQANASAFADILVVFRKSGFRIIQDERVMRSAAFPKNYAIIINHMNPSPITLVVTTRSSWREPTRKEYRFDSQSQLLDFLAQSGS